MKKIAIIPLFLLVSIVSCSLFQSSIKITEVVSQKEMMDSINNPAKIELMKRQLRQKVVEINNIVVKDISISNKIDYDFVVVADVKTAKGLVECYIYSKNIKTISELKKGETKIDISGTFERYFKLFDKYYLKIDIVNASINVSELSAKSVEKEENKKEKDKVDNGENK